MITVKDASGEIHKFSTPPMDYQFRFFSQGCLTRIYLYNTIQMRSERTVASFVNAVFVVEGE